MSKMLVVVVGPTGVGKTDLSIELAKRFNTSILSCDSRQVYKEMSIGTAVPERKYLEAVPHFFVHSESIQDYYSCWEFEQQALQKLEELFCFHDIVVMTGGSMMYIDAVCKGMDDIPNVDPEIRKEVMEYYKKRGIESLRMWLKKLDPDFYHQVDLKNAKRIMHAIEISLTVGQPYSQLRTGREKKRDFNIVKVGLLRPTEELYSRINDRVDQMVKMGIEDEARRLYTYRHLNALNTVGYKEWFAFFDGKIDRDEAIRLIKRNTRRYAKKQLSWFRRDSEIEWFHPDEGDKIMEFISNVE